MEKRENGKWVMPCRRRRPPPYPPPSTHTPLRVGGGSPGAHKNRHREEGVHTNVFVINDAYPFRARFG